LDVDAGAVRVLTLGSGRIRIVFSPEPETYDVEYFGWSHAWSPDGRWIAVLRNAAVECVDDPTSMWCERAELWIVSASGTQQTLIYAGPLNSDGGGVDWRRAP
jgi:hypothetical protein